MQPATGFVSTGHGVKAAIQFRLIVSVVNLIEMGNQGGRLPGALPRSFRNLILNLCKAHAIEFKLA